MKPVYNVAIHPSGYITGALAHMGLSKRANSEKSKRQRGAGGLTNHGKHIVLDGAALLDKFYHGRLSLLTWTFPPEYCDRIKAKWPTLMRLLLKKLRYWLEKQGLPDHYLGVTELQKNGNPHVHLIFVGRKSRFGNWLMVPALLDKLLFEAVDEVCGGGCDRQRFASAGRVEAVRGHAGRYMAKYLSKGNVGIPKSNAEIFSGVTLSQVSVTDELNQTTASSKDNLSSSVTLLNGWHPSSWYFCDRQLRRAAARAVRRFQLRCNPRHIKHLVEGVFGGRFWEVVREEQIVGFAGFVLPNAIKFLTMYSASDPLYNA